MQISKAFDALASLPPSSSKLLELARKCRFVMRRPCRIWPDDILRAVICAVAEGRSTNSERVPPCGCAGLSTCSPAGPWTRNCGTGGRTIQSTAFDLLDHVCERDLVLRDMVYFSLECLQEIEFRGAWWLTRLPEGKLVADADGQALDWIAPLRRSGASLHEWEVRVGNNGAP